MRSETEIRALLHTYQKWEKEDANKGDYLNAAHWRWAGLALEWTLEGGK